MAPRFPFTSFPQGWYVVAFSTDVGVGEVRTVHYLDHDIVLFRGASGVLSALDKTCPHLGAHLGGGAVDGECLRCPFHHWAYDREGHCVDVPYAPKIPPRAKVRRWHMLEQNGIVMVYYGRNDEVPPWTPPVLEDRGWTPNRGIRWEIRSHPQDVAENTVDCAHLGPVHHVTSCAVRKVEQHGHTMRVVLEMVASGQAIGMPDEVNDVELDVTLHGLGQVIASTHVINAGLRTRQRIHSTPIDGERIAIFGLNNTMEMPDPGYTREIDDIFWAAFVEDFPKDFPIWENKAYLERPLLAGGDGPIGAYRRWARQFYEPSEATQTQPIAPEPARGLRPRHLLTQAVDGLRRLAATAIAARHGAPSPAAGPDLQTAESDAPVFTAGPAASRPRAGNDGPRFSSVDAYFGTLEQRFDARAAGDLHAVFQWNLSGSRTIEHFAEVKAGGVRISAGAHHSPTLTIEMSQDDYLSMINGELNGALAFSTGRGRLQGPVRLAMRMQKLFPLERTV